MLYQKPKIPFTEICKRFDKEFFSDSPTRNEDTLYQYLWQIYYMLACKAKYFKNFNDYDDFASLAATTVFMRFSKKRDRGEKEHRSILNYAKKTLYYMKVMFQKETFNDIMDPEFTKIDSVNMENKLKTSINQDYRYGIEEELDRVFMSLPHIIKEVVLETPYKKDSLMIHRFYMSCLLSFLNSITLSNHDLESLHKREESNKDTNVYIEKIYRKNRNNSTILWNLEISYRDYVTLLVNKIRTILSQKFTTSANSFNLNEDVLDSIILSAYDNNINKEYEE